MRHTVTLWFSNDIWKPVISSRCLKINTQVDSILFLLRIEFK